VDEAVATWTPQGYLSRGVALCWALKLSSQHTARDRDPWAVTEKVCFLYIVGEVEDAGFGSV